MTGVTWVSRVLSSRRKVAGRELKYTFGAAVGDSWDSRHRNPFDHTIRLDNLCADSLEAPLTAFFDRKTCLCEVLL